MKNVVQLLSLSKTYQNGKQEFHALKDMTLSIEAGDFVSILGKSGSGKSTLLNVLAGIDTPSVGEVIVHDEALNLKNHDQLDTWRGKNIGLIFQFFQLMPTLSALENVMLPMDFIGELSRTERRHRATTLLEMVNLQDKLNMFPATLSGGEKQRVAIARALANNANIILADEPTGNLDTANAEMIYKLFENLNRQGKTVIIVSHDEKVCDYTRRTIRLSDGQVISDVTHNLEAACV